MAQVTLEVPRILRDCTSGQSQVGLDADRLEAVPDVLRERWPVLATHLFTGTGEVRPHVLLLLNGQLTRWISRPDRPLAAGDRLAIVQAVSGG